MSTNTASLPAVLFGKSMRAILARLYGRPDRRFYLREIARAAGTAPSSLQRDLAALAGAERGKQLTARGVIEAGEVDAAVALITEHLDERRPSFFRRRLELAVKDA